MSGNNYHTIRIKKKAWYIWLFWIVWLFWLAFWADLGFGSIKEREPRAAVIAFVVLGISLIAGIVRWLWKKD